MRGKRVAAGLSGGLDSVVLLHAMRGLAPRLGYKLSAIHVNHGLSPNAGDWQKFCATFCLELGVPFKAFKVTVKKQHHGLEAAAREARRAAFTKLGVDAIALAHHLDDQAETVLFNLLRGAGLAGASGMPAARQARSQAAAAAAARRAAQRDPRIRALSMASAGSRTNPMPTRR